MKKINTLILIFFTFFSFSLSAQMWNGVDTLYGNEWINYEQNYYKIMVADDGMFRVSYQNLVDNGIPVSAFEGSHLQLYHLGQEVPIFVTTNSSLSNNDYIEFYGKKNRSELDRFMFENPDEEMANPEYSMFTDSSAYFLTWDLTSTSNNRYSTNQLAITGNPTYEEYCYHTVSQVFSDVLSKKQQTSSTYASRFEVAEGFVSPFELSQTVSISANNIFTNGPNSTLSTRYAVAFGNANGTHQKVVKLNGSTISEDNFNFAKVVFDDFDVSTSTLSSSNEVLFEGLFNTDDDQGIAYVKLKYPHTFDFEGSESFEFQMPASNVITYLKFSNFNSTNSPVLYDLTNNHRLVPSMDGNGFRVALPPSTTERNLILVNHTTGIMLSDAIYSVDFVDYNQTDASFIIISHKEFIEGSSGTSWVQEYADYRSSTAGRGYTTTIVDIQQLYDQFAYGVNRHSMSIKNFGHFIKKTWTNPEYVFLIGKGRAYDDIRKEQDLAAAIANKTFFIPTVGTSFGAGDNLLLTNSQSIAPIISIGRIPIQKSSQIESYLDKVMTQELAQSAPQTINDRLWMKRAVHLGGGDPSEQASFRGYLNGFKSTFETTKTGGHVTSFFKQTADPIQNSQSDELKNIINNGISVLSFFGHSSAGVFDYSIDDAASYDNEGRYPVIFSFGCFSGRIHSNLPGISEDFVLTDKKGAIAFFANTGLAFGHQLNRFGSEYYSLMGNDMYGMGVGDISRVAIKNTGINIGHLVEQMTLNGDPSIRVLSNPGPDHVVDGSSVVFNPNPISIQNESFDISFDVVNLGRNIPGSKMEIEIIQRLPDGTLFTQLTDSITTPAFREKLTYTLPTLGNNSLGPNQFFIEVDKGNSIEELPLPDAESNNTLVSSSGTQGITVHFISNEVLPVFPEQYGIVSNPNLTLKASTSNTFADFQKYVIEIDTTNQFNSPIKVSTEVSQKGGIVKWKPEIPFTNNTVYYWRISPEEDPTLGGFIWRESSFLYLVGSDEGWNQSHFYQYDENRLSNIELPSSRNFQFIKDFKDISVENFAFVANANSSNNVLPFYAINSNITGTNNGFRNGVFIAVFDSLSIEPWHNPFGGAYGSLGEGNNQNIFSFKYKTNTPSQRQKVMTFLDDVVPDGNYVMFMSMLDIDGDFRPHLWANDSITLGKNIFSVLEQQGATSVRNLETLGSVPYIFFYKKGQNPIDELIASVVTDKLVMNNPVPGSWDEGFIESTNIGPANTWKSLQWNAVALDGISTTDEYSIDVLGIQENGIDSLLISNIQDTDASLTSINATDFPFIKLRFNSLDSIQKSSAHLEHWRVIYDGYPEVALDPNSHFSFYNDTLEQGEPLLLEVGVENIGRYDIDSLLVKYTVTDAANQQDSILHRVAPIIVGDSLIAQLEFDTKRLSGKNTINVELNPNEDQREQFHFNNLGFFDFFVNRDLRNPLLDVTFDGFHIMDGDVVSSKPNIMITLKDENKFLALDDTSLVKVFLQYPGDQTVRPINIDGDTLTFYPALPNSSNKARLEFKPHLFQDGRYILIVQAQDASGNQSGSLDYKVNFEIINKSSISNVLNYPNPFSTSTSFVFTITGDEIPENMKIQIMTVSGRIVREITSAELGPIHVGNNITDFKWNGTDDFGDKLANGVYLYRVVAQKANGESFDAFNTKADKFFKNGFGKMVIIR